MFKFFMIGLTLLIIIILLWNIVILPLAKEKEDKNDSTLEDLKIIASKNYEEREAIKKQAQSVEKTLHEIKTKTN